MKKLLAVTVALLLVLSLTSALADEPAPAFEKAGDKYEYGHFTVNAVVLNGNGEDFNGNPSFSIYQIDDYTAAVPWADGYDANGVTSDNNTASMYVVVTENHALVIDLGNGRSSTAGHFGEDAGDEAVLAGIDAEYNALVKALAGGREISVAITHNHGDHTGFRTALANEGYTIYFPEVDYTERMQQSLALEESYDLVTFIAGEFDITLDDITIKTIDCKGHTTGSTMFLITTPVVSYAYDASGAAVSSSAIYYLFSGDAIGSGGSVWIFSQSAFDQLASVIDAVYDELATYTNYNDFLGGEEKTDAVLRVEGGHGWQVTNMFGDMAMNLEFVGNLRDLCKIVPTGEWEVSDNTKDGLGALLLDGKAATKAADSWLNTTIYYGSNPEAIAAINTTQAVLDAVAGIVAE